MVDYKKLLEKVKSGEAKIEKLAEKSVKNIGSKKKLKVKKILKGKRMSVHIKESKPAEYVPVYFQGEWEDAKKSMFFQ